MSYLTAKTLVKSNKQTKLLIFRIGRYSNQIQDNATVR
jgi:hypothetical protein